MYACMHAWMDGWMDMIYGQVHKLHTNIYNYIYIHLIHTDMK